MDGGAGSLWHVSQERIGAVLVVHLGGEIDLETAPKLQQVLAQAPPEGQIVIEFGGVEYFDLAGVHVLEALYAQNPGRRLIVLTGLPPQVRRILELVGLTRTLRVAGTVEEALEMLRGANSAVD